MKIKKILKRIPWLGIIILLAAANTAHLGFLKDDSRMFWLAGGVVLAAIFEIVKKYNGE